MTDLRSSVKELRQAVGDSQQRFGDRLGLTLSTMVRYEHIRPPKGTDTLVRLAQIAEEIGRVDLAAPFDAALADLGVQRRH